jgi:hypothetical protein
MDVPAYESNGQQIVETLDAKWWPLQQAAELGPLWFEDHEHIFEWAVSQLDQS